MRANLLPLLGRRIRFLAIYDHKGDSSRQQKTLLREIFVDGGEFVTDHLWVNWPKTRSKIDMHNKIVRFEAGVRTYTRRDKSVDFGLYNLFQLEYFNARDEKWSRLS